MLVLNYVRVILLKVDAQLLKQFLYRTHTWEALFLGVAASDSTCVISLQL